MKDEKKMEILNTILGSWVLTRLSDLEIARRLFRYFDTSVLLISALNGVYDERQKLQKKGRFP